MKKPENQRPGHVVLQRSQEMETMLDEIRRRIKELAGVNVTLTEIFRRALESYLEELRESGRRRPKTEKRED